MGIDLVRVTVPDARAHICREILNSLPDWFGVPESIEEYALDCRAFETIAAFDGGAPVGFIALKETSADALDLYVLGIRPEYHRMGIGRRFVERAQDAAREGGKRLLCVTTLDSAHPDPYYARTRAFYRAMGFLPLITLPTLWGVENPCLVMVKPL